MPDLSNRTGMLEFMEQLKRSWPTVPVTILHARVAECRDLVNQAPPAVSFSNASRGN